MAVKSDEEKLRRFAERLDDEGRISIRDLRDDMGKILLVAVCMCGFMALVILAVHR